MAQVQPKWKKGRGTLGPLQPLIGTWSATTESPQGAVRCTRVFTRVLGGAYVQLTARWSIGTSRYEEVALYGPGRDGRLSFWSFTSDGKRSEGQLTDVSDIHPAAVGFEAQMPGGLARMAYWPSGDARCSWVVEARTKTGWKRVAEHHYKKR